ncbi:MAG TPA: hypothetical protein VHC18_13230 [Amycolatopsis sp.]|nr:hypothetical protein [Amycolatopsis sp.]
MTSLVTDARTDAATRRPKVQAIARAAQRAVDALAAQRKRQHIHQLNVGDRWTEHGLVFTSEVSTEMSVATVRWAVRRTAGLKPEDWTPRELGHSFVSAATSSGR